MARQDPRCRSPEKGTDTKHTCSSEDGRATGMPDKQLPKKVFYGELEKGGKRSQGGQKKHYKDTLKTFLKGFNIPPESWEHTAQERANGVDEYEAKRVCKVEEKRKERKITIRAVIGKIDLPYLPQTV